MEQRDINTTGMNLTEDSILKEIEQLEDLKSEAAILSQYSGSSSFMDNINILQNQWSKLLIAYKKSKDGESADADSEATSEVSGQHQATPETPPAEAEQVDVVRPSVEENNNDGAEEVVPLATKLEENDVPSESDSAQVGKEKLSAEDNNNDAEGEMPSATKSVILSESDAKKSDVVLEICTIEPEGHSMDPPTQEVLDV